MRVEKMIWYMSDMIFFMNLETCSVRKLGSVFVGPHVEIYENHLNFT